MINLLPADLKRSYVYARRNSRLRRWVIALLFGLVGVGIVTTSGLLYLQRSVDSYSRKTISSQDSLNAQNVEQTRRQSEDITSSLKLVVQVLSRQILFSKLLDQIATVTPANVALTNLSISNVQGSLDVTAVSSDYQSATQLQVNLADPNNKIFSKADIQSIICLPNPDDPQYPCTVVLRALFAGDNPYMLISKTGSNK